MFTQKKPPAQLDWRTTFEQLAQTSPDGPLRRFYEAGVIAFDCPLKDTPMVSLDLETTGLDSTKDTIISVGLVPMSSQRIQCNGAKYWMVKPESHLSSESVTIHEITHSDIAKAPSLADCFEEILIALAGKVIVVHCVSIERNFLLQAALKLYGQPLYFPVLDTMDIEAKVLNNVPWLQRAFKRRQSIRLDACRQRYNLPRYKAHHALIDAFSSAELLQAQIAHHMQPEDEISNYWL